MIAVPSIIRSNCICNSVLGRYHSNKTPYQPRHDSRLGPSTTNLKPRSKNSGLKQQRSFIVMASSGSSKVATEQSISELNEKFGIPGSVEFVEGNGKLPKARLTHASGASAEIYLFGACVTSWKQASGDEVLYIRPDAVFDKSKAISGGVPICFPQFGPGELPQHGFARDSDWQVVATSADPQPDEKDPRIEFLLTETDATMEIYPHTFKAIYTVTLHGEQLKTEFRVVNTGDKPMSFTGALHGYYEVQHVSKARVSGLKGLKTLDKVPDPNNPVPGVMTEEYLYFNGPTDKIFLDAKDYVELEVGTGAAIAMTSKNWGDVVCWNPWTEMPTFYENFVCVENANFQTQTIQAGDSWIAETDYSIKNV